MPTYRYVMSKKKEKKKERERRENKRERKELKKLQGHLLDHFKQRIKTVWYIRSSIFQSLWIYLIKKKHEKLFQELLIAKSFVTFRYINRCNNMNYAPRTKSILSPL